MAIWTKTYRLLLATSVMICLGFMFSCGKIQPIELDKSNISGVGDIVCSQDDEGCIDGIQIGSPDFNLQCDLVLSSKKIRKGQTVTVTIQSKSELVAADVDGLLISELEDPKLTLSPQNTKTLRAKVKNKAGYEATCTAEVEVVEDVTQPLPSCSLTASHSQITAGDSVTLTMRSTNATVSKLQNVTVSSQSAVKSFKPTQTTTYRGDVTGAGGSNSCSVVVKVTPANPVDPDPPKVKPTCKLTASSSSITAGQQVAIAMQTTNATSATLDGAVVPASGTGKSFKPTATKKYLGTVAGPGGNATCEVTVTVQAAPKPTCTLTPSSTSITRGQSVTLTLTSTNATSGRIVSKSVSPNGGTAVYTPTTNTNWSATVTGAGGSATCTTTVIVNAGPKPTCSLRANTTLVTYGGYVTLSLTTSGATSAKIENVATTTPTGSRLIRVYAGKTYSAQATNINGTTTCTSPKVNVVSPERLCVVNGTCACPSGQYIKSFRYSDTRYCRGSFFIGASSGQCLHGFINGGLPCRGCYITCQSR